MNEMTALETIFGVTFLKAVALMVGLIMAIIIINLVVALFNTIVQNIKRIIKILMGENPYEEERK